MKLMKINKPIKCDTVMCNINANYQLCTDSYKGYTFLCEKCFQQIQKLFKRTTLKNEQEKQ